MQQNDTDENKQNLYMGTTSDNDLQNLANNPWKALLETEHDMFKIPSEYIDSYRSTFKDTNNSDTSTLPNIQSIADNGNSTTCKSPEEDDLSTSESELLHVNESWGTEITNTNKDRHKHLYCTKSTKDFKTAKSLHEFIQSISVCSSELELERKKIDAKWGDDLLSTESATSPQEDDAIYIDSISLHQNKDENLKEQPCELCQKYKSKSSINIKLSKKYTNAASDSFDETHEKYTREKNVSTEIYMHCETHSHRSLHSQTDPTVKSSLSAELNLKSSIPECFLEACSQPSKSNPDESVDALCSYQSSDYLQSETSSNSSTSYVMEKLQKKLQKRKYSKRNVRTYKYPQRNMKRHAKYPQKSTEICNKGKQRHMEENNKHSQSIKHKNIKICYKCRQKYAEKYSPCNIEKYKNPQMGINNCNKECFITHSNHIHRQSCECFTRTSISSYNNHTQLKESAHSYISSGSEISANTFEYNNACGQKQKRQMYTTTEDLFTIESYMEPLKKYSYDSGLITMTECKPTVTPKEKCLCLLRSMENDVIHLWPKLLDIHLYDEMGNINNKCQIFIDVYHDIKELIDAIDDSDMNIVENLITKKMEFDLANVKSNLENLKGTKKFEDHNVINNVEVFNKSDDFTQTEEVADNNVMDHMEINNCIEFDNQNEIENFNKAFEILMEILDELKQFNKARQIDDSNIMNTVENQRTEKMEFDPTNATGNMENLKGSKKFDDPNVINNVEAFNKADDFTQTEEVADNNVMINMEINKAIEFDDLNDMKFKGCSDANMMNGVETVTTEEIVMTNVGNLNDAIANSNMEYLHEIREFDNNNALKNIENSKGTEKIEDRNDSGVNIVYSMYCHTNVEESKQKKIEEVDERNTTNKTEIIKKPKKCNIVNSTYHHMVTEGSDDMYITEDEQYYKKIKDFDDRNTLKKVKTNRKPKKFVNIVNSIYGQSDTEESEEIYNRVDVQNYKIKELDDRNTMKKVKHIKKPKKFVNIANSMYHHTNTEESGEIYNRVDVQNYKKIEEFDDRNTTKKAELIKKPKKFVNIAKSMYNHMYIEKSEDRYNMDDAQNHKKIKEFDDRKPIKKIEMINKPNKFVNIVDSMYHHMDTEKSQDMYNRADVQNHKKIKEFDYRNTIKNVKIINRPKKCDSIVNSMCRCKDTEKNDEHQKFKEFDSRNTVENVKVVTKNKKCGSNLIKNVKMTQKLSHKHQCLYYKHSEMNYMTLLPITDPEALKRDLPVVYIKKEKRNNN